MSDSASVVLSTVENAFCVSVAALGEDNGVTVLYNKDSVLLGSLVTVTIGAADSEYVQILDGISAGVAVSYPTTIPCPAAPDPSAVPCH